MMVLFLCLVVVTVILWLIWCTFFNRVATSQDLGVPTAGRMANPVPGIWWK